jgi:hypothetical protein
MKIAKNKIIDLENRRVEGIRNSDVAILDNLLHNDLLFLAPTSQI